MGRVRKPFNRPEGKLDANLIVIAAEGEVTERIYFEALAKEYDKSSLHIEIIREESGEHKPDPQSVFKKLESFSEQYELEPDDELWMVIDRDYQSWEPKMIKEIAQLCHQKKGFYLALSNPCFELWLILHIKDISKLPQKEKDRLFSNQKVNKSKTYTQKFISDEIGGFNPQKYDPRIFLSNIEVAIEQGKALDISPYKRWPDFLGTRVHRLVSKII